MRDLGFKFDGMKEANSIARAIDKVLEQQKIEWLNQGVQLETINATCGIGLANAVYSELANSAAMRDNKFDTTEDFVNFYKNNECVEAAKVRKNILETCKELLKKKATWENDPIS